VPTYEYACTECGHGFEAVQKFSDDALTECPQCHGRLRKVFAAVGVVFKGSGFYHNDSRASSTMKSNGHARHDSKPSASTESATGSTSESAAKPAESAKPAAAAASTSSTASSSSSAA
jgi:putative FmdB family regulatory protein